MILWLPDRLLCAWLRTFIQNETYILGGHRDNRMLLMGRT